MLELTTFFIIVLFAGLSLTAIFAVIWLSITSSSVSSGLIVLVTLQGDFHCSPSEGLLFILSIFFPDILLIFVFLVMTLCWGPYLVSFCIVNTDLTVFFLRIFISIIFMPQNYTKGYLFQGITFLLGGYYGRLLLNMFLFNAHFYY